MTARVVVAFQVPLREDAVVGEGRLHPPFRWKLLTDLLSEEFWGWTNTGTWEGEWRRDDTSAPVREMSRAFQVDVAEDRLDEIRGVLRRACKTFQQECIRMVIRGEAEYVEGGPNDQPL